MCPPYQIDFEFEGRFIPRETVAWPTRENAMTRLKQYGRGRYRIRCGTCGELRKMQGEVIHEEVVDGNGTRTDVRNATRVP